MDKIYYELIWLFFWYGFLGWGLEVAVAAIKKRKFANKGLINGPFSVRYAIAATWIIFFFRELHGVWLFLAGAIVFTLMQWFAGHFVEKFYHEKWWDYSDYRWNIDGYICLPISAFLGLCTLLFMKWGNPFLLKLFEMLPTFPGKLLIWILVGMLALDVIATLIILGGRSRRIAKWQNVDQAFTDVSNRFVRWIYEHVDRRIRKAYEAKHVPKRVKEDHGVFAYGCSFDKIVWLFVIGSFLGDITETLFCRATAGVWMSRSSLVWGDFSVVWGFAIAAATVLLYKYRDGSDRSLFLVGTFLGGAYEYICSVLSELVFGKVFWDYSKIPFNLGGRINLLYCFFWGIAAVVWMKMLYPFFSGLIEKVPKKAGHILTWVMLVFMVCNMLFSAMALIRSAQRAEGASTGNVLEEYLDTNYDDEKLEQIYPNAIQVK